MRHRSTPATRRTALASAGVPADLLEELLAYDEPLFSRLKNEPSRFPLPDEPHLEAWARYAEQAQSIGAVPALSKRFPQLRFPIREGISRTEEYRRATRQGLWSQDDLAAERVPLRDPDRVTLKIHATMAGGIPVLTAEDRADFENLVRAFSARNEPVEVPRSMGACIVTGLNNWDRLNEYRRRWEASRPFGNWEEEFARVILRRELYEDRFLILSCGPYSGVAADEANFSEPEWARLSLAIRREHECAHYFTFRLAGKMRNNLLDEVLADYVGLVRTLSRYDPDLALRFFGLERFPSYREGARLQNYRGNPPLSAAAFGLVRRLVHAAVHNLARLDSDARLSSAKLPDLPIRLIWLASMSLGELAAGDLFVRRRSGPRRRLAMRIPAGRAGMDRAIEAFSRFAARHAMSDKVVSDVQVVLDEILSNIVKYGGTEAREDPIALELAVEGARLRIEILDDGREFNVLGRPNPDLTLSVTDKPVGGLGLYLVRKLTDEQRYDRLEGKNRLVLFKNL